MLLASIFYIKGKLTYKNLLFILYKIYCLPGLNRIVNIELLYKYFTLAATYLGSRKLSLHIKYTIKNIL